MKVLAATLPACAWVVLAFVATAHGSDARGGEAIGSVSITAETYCDELRQGISAETFQFSTWRCKQGPAMRGHETILGWVTMTEAGGKAHVELIWLVETQPIESAQVIDARIVPYYGYEPTDVRTARASRSAQQTA